LVRALGPRSHEGDSIEPDGRQETGDVSTCDSTTGTPPAGRWPRRASRAYPHGAAHPARGEAGSPGHAPGDRRQALGPRRVRRHRAGGEHRRPQDPTGAPRRPRGSPLRADRGGTRLPPGPRADRAGGRGGGVARSRRRPQASGGVKPTKLSIVSEYYFEAGELEPNDLPPQP